MKALFGWTLLLAVMTGVAWLLFLTLQHMVLSDVWSRASLAFYRVAWVVIFFYAVRGLRAVAKYFEAKANKEAK